VFEESYPLCEWLGALYSRVVPRKELRIRASILETYNDHRRDLMRNFLLTAVAAVVAVALVVALTPSTSAADDGQTQPRLSYGDVTASNTPSDIIAMTNGSGNIRGVYCQFISQGPVFIKFYVNGGAAQTITITNYYFPPDSNGNRTSGWVPFNIRFTSSIHVQMYKGSTPGSPGGMSCVVSWALD
jgi:hypothetical protein